jgi:hypothetical protein
VGGSLLDRALGALFGRAAADGDPDRQLVAELTDLIVDTVEPKVRAHRRYREKLEPCVRSTMAWLRELGRTALDPVVLARANWGSDPRLNTFFPDADSIPALLGRSKELRSFFEEPEHASADEAFALLGMKREERTVLGPRYEGGMLKQDVAQTTVNFTGHRLVAIAADEATARLETGRRIVLRMAQVALSRILEIDRKGLEHERHKAYLSTRLRLLELARDGVGGITDDPSTVAQQIEEVKRERDQAVKDYIETKATLVTLDGYIDQIEAVFGYPAQHVALSRGDLNVSRMSVKVEAGSEEAHHSLTLAELRIGERVDAVIAFVRCPRSELPKPQNLLAQAERFL